MQEKLEKFIDLLGSEFFPLENFQGVMELRQGSQYYVEEMWFKDECYSDTMNAFDKKSSGNKKYINQVDLTQLWLLH